MYHVLLSERLRILVPEFCIITKLCMVLRDRIIVCLVRLLCVRIDRGKRIMPRDAKQLLAFDPSISRCCWESVSYSSFSFLNANLGKKPEGAGRCFTQSPNELF